jgi:competence protein ComEC
VTSAAHAPAGEALGPLAPVCLVSLATGLAVGRLGPVRVDGARMLVGLLAATAIVLLLASVARGALATALVILAAALVMATGVLVRLHTFEAGLIPLLVDRGGSALIEAQVVAEPRAGARGWQTVVRVSTVDGVATRERAVVFLAQAEALGTPLRLRASARPLPGDGYGRWLTQHHVTAILDVRELTVVGRPGLVAHGSEQVRARIRRAATRHLDEDVGGLLVGFVTGDTRLLPDDDAAAMKLTGLTHLTAVSGSNTAVLLVGVAALLGFLGAGARLRWTVLALTVPWFAFLTRLEPSVLRAGTMALLVIAAAVRGVARDARHLLAGAVLLLLTLDPLLSWSLGLLLSAGATVGVLVIAPRLAVMLERVLPRAVAQLLGITVGAQVAVAPVLLASFGAVGLVSVPANMLAVPLAAVGAAVAFVASAVALVSVPAASSLFVLAAPAAWGVLRVARAGAALPAIERLSVGPRAAAGLALGAVLVAIVRMVAARMPRAAGVTQSASIASVKSPITRAISLRSAGRVSRSATTAPSA